jgi:hypothetical protein
VRRCVSKSLNEIDYRADEVDIWLSIQIRPLNAPSEQNLITGDLAGISEEEVTPSALDERMVRIWDEWMRSPYQPCNADLYMNLSK